MTFFQITPREDPNLRKIVLYVADFLNNRYQNQVESSGLTNLENQLIVRHTEIYDAFEVPHDSFPLLKIYRRYSQGQLENSHRESKITLSYCLLNSQIRQAPAIANWVDINAREALAQFTFEHPGVFEINSSITCDYRTLLQLGEIVYQVDLSFSLGNESNLSCNPNPLC